MKGGGGFSLCRDVPLERLVLNAGLPADLPAGYLYV